MLLCDDIMSIVSRLIFKHILVILDGKWLAFQNCACLAPRLELLIRVIHMDKGLRVAIVDHVAEWSSTRCCSCRRASCCLLSSCSSKIAGWVESLVDQVTSLLLKKEIQGLCEISSVHRFLS